MSSGVKGFLDNIVNVAVVVFFLAISMCLFVIGIFIVVIMAGVLLTIVAPITIIAYVVSWLYQRMLIKPL